MNVEPPFAVAVSGGADSLALMLLAAAYCRRRRAPPPLALTVDHKLREGSGLEAERVAAWARAREIPHETLVWIGRKPAANIQAHARAERYRLIGERMREREIETLLTGHTRDDQAETFLLRLARGSGLDGLAGMQATSRFPLPDFPDLRIARPLLELTHDRLAATLTERGQPWIEDPSNANDRFARVQVRNLLPALTAIGVTPERIAAATDHLRRAREAIEASVAALLAGTVELSPCGYALLAPARFGAAPDEIALRALARLIEGLGGGNYKPRFEQTEAALVWLRTGALPKGRTFAGCRLERRPDGRILIAREEAGLARSKAVPLQPGAQVLWDRRFLLALSPAARAVDVRHLGAAGVKAAGARAAFPPVEPHRIAATTPGLWRGGRLVAAPLLGVFAEDAAVSARFVGLSANVDAPLSDTGRKHL